MYLEEPRSQHGLFLIVRAAAGAVGEPPDRFRRGLNRQTVRITIHFPICEESVQCTHLRQPPGTVNFPASACVLHIQ